MFPNSSGPFFSLFLFMQREILCHIYPSKVPTLIHLARGKNLRWMPPKCLPDASQMPLRCLSDGSQMPPRCPQMPSRCPQMLPRCLQMPPRCLSDTSQMASSSPLTPDVSQMPQRDFILKTIIWSKNRKKNEVQNIANLGFKWDAKWDHKLRKM